MKLHDIRYNQSGSTVTELTSNSVRVTLLKVPSPPGLDPPRIGINCQGWFSTLTNNKGESEFNQRFKAE